MGLGPVFVQSQEIIHQPGPVIYPEGAIFYGYTPEHPVDTAMDYFAVFDIHSANPDDSQLNGLLNSLARYINLHARYGVPVNRIHVAGVFHGSAGKDALSDAAYLARFGKTNPNTPLLDALSEAGAQLFLCGQTAYSRDLDPATLHPGVQLALSAMTILTEYQQKGYALIRF
ncbi:MAG: DsrE family protein [Saprospiraceae bacterium]